MHLNRKGRKARKEIPHIQSDVETKKRGAARNNLVRALGPDG
jgi:hypothetical protein